MPTPIKVLPQNLDIATTLSALDDYRIIIDHLRHHRAIVRMVAVQTFVARGRFPPPTTKRESWRVARSLVSCTNLIYKK